MTKRGPKTTAGKDVVRLNAVRHGVLSPTPVIPDLEREEEWEAHRSGVLMSLRPEGNLEQELAERIALLLWRLRRVARYETESIRLSQEQVEEDLAEEREEGLSRKLEFQPKSLEEANEYLRGARERVELLQGLPSVSDDTEISRSDAITILWVVAVEVDEDWTPDDLQLPGLPDDIRVEEFDDWNVRLVREGIDSIASQSGDNPDDLLSAAIETAEDKLAKQDSQVRQVITDLDRMHRERLLPQWAELDKIMRYEAHLNRQLNQTLHELEALQTRRQGGVTPLARVDVQGLPEN